MEKSLLNKILLIFVFCLLSCSKKNMAAMETETTLIENKDYISFGTAELAESSMIFSNNHLEIEFLNKIIVDSNIYTLGDKISEKIESNYILENKFFFAFNKDTKLNALSENKTIIGWNKNNRIVFISSENEKAKTTLNVGVGDTEEDVYKKYGEPTTKGNNCYRYENYEYEFMGLVFYFENKKVYRIVSFSSI